MRILLSFLQDQLADPHPIPAYRFWSYYIKNGVAEAGLEWLEVPQLDWAEGLTFKENDPLLKHWRQMAWERTVKYIKDNRKNIDVFLTYLYPQQIDIAAIAEIKKLGIPCVNFYCDHIRQFTKVPPEFKVFDLMWVPEFEALPMYQNAGISYINLPMPMWVDHRFRNYEPHENSVISFIGSSDAIREKILSAAIKNGLPLQVRGSGWKDNPAAFIVHRATLLDKFNNQRAFVKKHGLKGLIIYHSQRFASNAENKLPAENIFEKPDADDYISITRESRITLGINSVPSFKALNTSPLAYSRLRDIEAPMLGACYLTEYTKGITELYNLGQEIETYSSADELIFKCKELMNDAAKRQHLKKQGQHKALNCHDLPSSLKKLKHKLYN